MVARGGVGARESHPLVRGPPLRIRRRPPAGPRRGRPPTGRPGRRPPGHPWPPARHHSRCASRSRRRVREGKRRRRPRRRGSVAPRQAPARQRRASHPQCSMPPASRRTRPRPTRAPPGRSTARHDRIIGSSSHDSLVHRREVTTVTWGAHCEARFTRRPLDRTKSHCRTRGPLDREALAQCAARRDSPAPFLRAVVQNISECMDPVRGRRCSRRRVVGSGRAVGVVPPLRGRRLKVEPSTE